MSKKYSKKRKKDRDQRAIERYNRKMKESANSMADEISTYTKMLDDFTSSMVLLETICHTAVRAQYEKHAGQPLDVHSEKFLRLAELQKLDIGINAIKQQIEDCRNIFSLIKKVKNDPMKCFSLLGEKFIPVLSNLQVGVLNIFDMFKMCIPKNREVLEEMAKTNEHVHLIISAIDDFEKNLPKEEAAIAEAADLSITDIPMTEDIVEETSAV